MSVEAQIGSPQGANFCRHLRQFESQPDFLAESKIDLRLNRDKGIVQIAITTVGKAVHAQGPDSGPNKNAAPGNAGTALNLLRQLKT
jgi:hypothetical protein